MSAPFRFAVESWAPEYGAPVEGEPASGKVQPDVRLDIELPPPDWRPLGPRGDRAKEVVFVDGVQRVDARVWVTDSNGDASQGLCASFAAGFVRCNGTATILRDTIKTGHAVIGAGVTGPIETTVARYDAAPVAAPTSESLFRELEQRRRTLEEVASQAATDADLLVLDGSLLGRDQLANAIGYLKSHEVTYLTGDQGQVITALAPGERTPVFLTTTSWSRYSWYLRLPCEREHPWSGIVRCEASSRLEPEQVIHLADLSANTLPAFASAPHKDPRAPQNLYPIAGLERDLRRRMGDQQLLYRALRAAART